MNMAEMKTLVRRDLHDEDPENYRWTDSEIERHIAHALRDFSESMPHEQKADLATSPGSREIDISSLAGRVAIEAVEYPAGEYPARYRRFSLWGDIITLPDDDIPDGSDARVFYGKLHTLDGSISTIPAVHEDLVAAGACGYAAVEWAVYAVNRVNVGGTTTSGEILEWGTGRLKQFRQELKRLGRKNRVRVRNLYRPSEPPASQSKDYGP